MKSYELRSGKTIIKIVTVSKAYGDSYDILITTSTGYLNAEFLIAHNKDLNRQAIMNLNEFISFVKKDKEIMINEYREYTPVIYDPTVYIQ